MPLRAFARRCLKRLRISRLAGALTVLALVAVGVVAAQQPGFPQQPPVPLNRSIWVVDADKSLVGRINPDAAELDSALAVKGSVDLLQDPGLGSPVLLDRSAHELQLIDPATVTVGTRVAVPDDALVTLDAGTVAVADRVDGRLWFGRTQAIGSVDAHLVKQLSTLGPKPAVAVSTVGTVFATAPGSDRITVGQADGSLTTQAVAGGRLPAVSLPAVSLPTVSPPAQPDDLQISALGETPVVLDRRGPDLRIGDRTLTLPGDQGLQTSMLQRPGPTADAVFLTTASALLRIDLATGTVTKVASSGTGTTGSLPPVEAGGCTYAVWTGAAPMAVRACPGGQALPRSLPGVTGASDLRISANGDGVAVNDITSGRSFLAADDFRVVDNWNDVAPQDVTAADPSDVQNQDVSDQTPPPPPSCGSVQVGAPHAKDDAFGVRAGRATVLRVLDNDPAAECTSVVIDSVSALPPTVGVVAVVDGGAAIQVTTVPGAIGTLPPIRYQVSNGKGRTAQAVVLVTVEPPSVEKAPVRIRRAAVEVEGGATVTYNVLQDYFSPTGDDLYLLSAATDGGDAVSFRPDGSITYRSTGTGIGTDRKVAFVVSDGSQQSTGVMTVSIADVGSSTPVSFPVHVSGLAGSTVTVDPTRNLTSASAQPVVIGKLTPQAGSGGATATLAPGGQLISVASSTGGSYYFTFDAAAGNHSTTGVLRADFTAGSAAGPAVAMVDVAYLPAGGSAVVDPLANDSDPAGLGLAVRQVQVPAGEALTAAVVDLHLVRIEAPRPPSGPISLSYSLYDGHTDQTGQIRVVPVPAATKVPPPVASPVSVTVRAGDAVSIPIADHAYSQDGTAVTAVLDPASVAGLPGRVFSTGSEIRYLAPLIAPSAPFTFSYTAVAAGSTPTDPAQAVSTVTVTVVTADASQDRAPGAPAPVVARVFVGGSISIPLPLDGIDPDGDWVVTSSLRQPVAPLGSVSLAGPDSLSYQAFSKPGLDVVSYLVTDPYGRSAVGTATVLVVPPVDAAGPPIAPDLTASVRPGRSVRIDPLADVVDPGGRVVTLADPAFTAPPGLAVVRDDNGLVVTAPNVPTQVSLRYNVINTAHLGATGAISLTVSASAPIPLPEAADVFVPPGALRPGVPTVQVDVSTSVTNRSGRRDQLTVSVDPVSAQVATMVGPATLRITLAEHRQVIAYRARNSDGGTAIAFVVVPGRTQTAPPELIAGKAPIQLDAGATVQVAVADYVTVAHGSPEIAPDSPLGTTQGTATRISGGAFSLTTPSTAGGAAVVYVPITSAGTQAPTVLGLAVQIVPKVIPAPQLDNAVLPVEVGASARLDLRPLTTTFDDSQALSLTYEVGSVIGADAGAGAVPALEGSMLTVSVRQGIARGTEFSIPVMVTDGQGKSGTAVVTVQVTGSRKPLPTVVDAHVLSARPGVAVSANVLAGSSDPIGLGLGVSQVKVTAGAAGVRSGPSLAGSTVTVTPAAGFVGDIVVSFQVTDGTKDPDRAVGGTLTITTQDVPSAPGTPAAVPSSLSARGVELSWAASDSHGAAVTGYTVTGTAVTGDGSTGGSIVQTCPGAQASCQINGLSTGSAYRFVVVARNAVGDSAPSPVSADVVPDAAPSQPSAPQARYLQRGQIQVTWQIPSGAFTPVRSMTLRQVLDGTVVQTYPGVSSPLTLSNLDNTKAFDFQVRATNAVGDGPWSDPSGKVVASGVPSAPVGVVARYQYDGVTESATVSWQPPADDGGEPVAGYRLLQNGVVVDQQASSPQTVVLAGTAPVSFTVVALNHRGDGQVSAAGAASTVSPWTRPTAPDAPTLTVGDTLLTAAWTGGSTPGRAVGGYQYQLGGAGDWIPVGTGHTATIANLTNSRSYSIAVRVCNTEAGAAAITCSAGSPPTSAVPLGPPAKPVIGAVTPGTPVTLLTATWTWPDVGARPVTSRSVTIAVNGAPVAGIDTGAGTWSQNVGWNATVTIDATECVSGPDLCVSAVQRTYSTPQIYAYTVIGPPPLLGSCAGGTSYGGDWPDQAACGGAWQADGTAVQVLSCTTGAAYPRDPVTTPPTTDPVTTTPTTDPVTTPPTTDPVTTPTTPVPPTTDPVTTPVTTTPVTTAPVVTDDQWFRDVDGLWFRAPSLSGSGASGC